MYTEIKIQHGKHEFVSLLLLNFVKFEINIYFDYTVSCMNSNAFSGNSDELNQINLRS